MFDFAWSELAIIGVVAVVVLGPKELPQAMRAIGKFTRQARKLASEFQGHVNDLVREAELEEVRTSVQRITNTNVGTEIDKLLDPGGDFAAELARTEQEMQAALQQNSAALGAPAETVPVETPAVAEAVATAPAEPAAAPAPLPEGKS